MIAHNTIISFFCIMKIICHTVDQYNIKSPEIDIHIQLIFDNDIKTIKSIVFSTNDTGTTVK